MRLPIKIRTFFILIFSSLISICNNTVWAYSCALTESLPIITFQYTYPNSGFVAKQWVLERDQHLDDTLASTSKKQIKIFNTQQQLIPYRIRPLVDGYVWLQPTSAFEKKQNYLIDQQDFSNYADPIISTATPNIQLEITDHAFNPQRLNKNQIGQLKFKSSEFADPTLFGYGGLYKMDLELTIPEDFQDHLIYVRLQNYTQNKATAFILNDLSYASPQHATLHFINDICIGNLDFYPNEKWKIQVDLINPLGHVIQDITAPLIFNTSGEDHLSLWDKIINWWQNIKLKWL